MSESAELGTTRVEGLAASATLFAIPFECNEPEFLGARAHGAPQIWPYC
jgi:hypothetical protein